MFPAELREVLACSLQAAITDNDPLYYGVGRCEWSAAAGAEILKLLTGDEYRPVGGYAWCVKPEIVTKPKATPSPDLPQKIMVLPRVTRVLEQINSDGSRPLEFGHAWIQRDDTVIDFTTRPVAWGAPQNYYSKYLWSADLTRYLAEKFSDKRMVIVPAIVMRVIGEIAPDYLRITDRPGHVLSRIAARWPALADKLASELTLNDPLGLDPG